MWIQRLRERAGRVGTAVAAGLVFATVAVPAVIPGWFGLERPAAVPGLLAVGLLAASLLDRFRPTRWFLLVSLPSTWLLLSAIGAATGYRGVLFFQTACATLAWVLLNSAPVRDHFRQGGGWTERFFRRARGEPLLDSGDTERLWDYDGPPVREAVAAGKQAPPDWWLNP